MTVENRIALYNRYARLRDKQKLTDYKVSKAIGVGNAMFSHWKQGKYVPKPEKLKPIAELLGVEVSYFL